MTNNNHEITLQEAITMTLLTKTLLNSPDKPKLD